VYPVASFLAHEHLHPASGGIDVLGGLTTDGQKPGQSTPQVHANAADVIITVPNSKMADEIRLFTLKFI